MRQIYFSNTIFAFLATVISITFFTACNSTPEGEDFQQLDLTTFSDGAGEADSDGFVWQAEQFADLKIVRYQVPGWEKLSESQQSLVYCLNMAGLSGRDMMYDQNNRYNLRIRRMLESIHDNYSGDRGTIGWNRFETYLKRIWFSNGIHHHYSNKKHIPEFSAEYFDHLLSSTATTCDDEIRTVMLDPSVQPKKVELDRETGLVEGSSVNFYGPNVTTEEAEAYFESIKVH